MRALDDACTQTRRAEEFASAASIAERALSFAPEYPRLYHSAACAYAAVGDLAKALEHVRLAIEHDYEHLAELEVDPDLGALLDSTEHKALFRDWHARREGN